jgi:hypothetical protein
MKSLRKNLMIVSSNDKTSNLHHLPLTPITSEETTICSPIRGGPQDFDDFSGEKYHRGNHHVDNSTVNNSVFMSPSRCLLTATALAHE